MYATAAREFETLVRDGASAVADEYPAALATHVRADRVSHNVPQTTLRERRVQTTEFLYRSAVTDRRPRTMLDEIFEVVFDVILELVPTVILKIVLLLVGLVAVAVGVPLIADAPLVGGALTVLGAAAVIGVLASWVL